MFRTKIQTVLRGQAKTPSPLYCPDEAATRQAGADLAAKLRAGDVVLLEGELGAGKTTFVKGALEALGYHGVVRSPTFNLIQTFATEPPVLHADLYRVPSAAGLDIEESLATHIVFIEWADRAGDLVRRMECWIVLIAFEGEGRTIAIAPPETT